MKNKPILSDMSKISEDMMGPGKCKEYSIYVDPHSTPDFVKEEKRRVIPAFPIIYEIADHTWQVNEFGMSSFYVLAGRERGLVIDCGCGSIDAKSLIEHLCPLPYDVAITHGHGDHCGSMCQFEKVWIFPEDIPLIRDGFRVNQQLWENPNIWGSFPARYPDGTPMDAPGCTAGGKVYYDYTNLTFMGIDPEHLPEMQELKDGQVFDLGGRRVEVLHMPGHTRGCAVFIDPKTRIAFTGDSFNQSFRLAGNTAAENVKLLKKLQKHCSEFDRMFPGHTAVGANTANFSQSPQLLPDVIRAYQSIADGTAVVKEKVLHGRTIKVAVYGKAEVALDEKPPEGEKALPEGETAAELEIVAGRETAAG
ncbi:MAG: MBL fold metallo-hydrolase [Lachnospiraceae bacterium]|nr:MBL fold metallo-hydrolase [Lachnospiraceae bacterium]